METYPGIILAILPTVDERIAKSWIHSAFCDAHSRFNLRFLASSIVVNYVRQAMSTERLNLVITQGVLGQMAQVIVGENEGIESALRRFKRQVSRADIFSDIKKKRYFETPIEKAKRKAISRRRKRRFKANSNNTNANANANAST